MTNLQGYPHHYNNPLHVGEQRIVSNSLWEDDTETEEEWEYTVNTISAFYTHSLDCDKQEEEEEELWLMNPLFDGCDKNYLLQEGQLETERLLVLAKMKMKIPFDHDSQWSARDLVDFVVTASETHFTRDDACVFLHEMVRPCHRGQLYPLLVPSQYHMNCYDQFVDSSECYYRPIDEEHPKFYEETISGAISLMNVRAKPKSRIQQTEEHIFHSLIDTLVPFKPAYLIVRQVEDVLERLLAQHLVFVDNDNMKQGYISYHTISFSEHMKELKQTAEALRYMDTSVLGPQELRYFFCNVYNMMCIHALLIRGCADNETDRNKFFSQEFYFIGNHRLSMNDILNVILRGKGCVGYKYYLNGFKQNCLMDLECNHHEYDPRILFALCDGTLSSPLPYVLKTENAEETLHLAAKAFVNLRVQIYELEKRIVLPPFFNTYKSDFCSNNTDLELLQYISRFMVDHNRNALTRLLKNSNISLEESNDQFIDVDIQYEEYNWRSNRKPRSFNSIFNEDVMTIEISVSEVIENMALRPYFKLFCEHEYSVENCLFVEAVSAFKRFPPGADRYQYALNIIDQFLKPGTEYEVNITRKLASEVIKTCAESKENLGEDVFDSLMREIHHNLLETFIRFRNTDMYRSMLEDYIRREAEKSEKKTEEIVAFILQKQKEKDDQQRQIEESLTTPSPVTNDTLISPSILLASSPVPESPKHRMSLFRFTPRTGSTDSLSTAAGKTETKSPRSTLEKDVINSERVGGRLASIIKQLPLQEKPAESPGPVKQSGNGRKLLEFIKQAKTAPQSQPSGPSTPVLATPRVSTAANRRQSGRFLSTLQLWENIGAAAKQESVPKRPLPTNNK